MNVPDYETSLYIYLKHKKTKWEQDENLFKRDLMDYLLSVEKKKIEKDWYCLQECLDKENIPMRYKINNEISEETIKLWWNDIRKDYKECKYEGVLSEYYLHNPPKPLKIWKVKYSPYRNDLRYCGADLFLGILNTYEYDLEIDILMDGKKWEHLFIGKDQRSEFQSPIWFSRDVYTHFKLKNPSHYNFYLLYVWFPESIRNKKDNLPSLEINV